MPAVDRLRRLWPMMTWSDTGDLPRTVVVVHSISMPLPPAWQPLLPAYEERFLCYLLTLVSRGTRVVYVTSMPVLPRLVDYWLGLVPGLDTPETRSRLVMVPVVDGRPVPLTRKVLDHPGTVRRIRDAVVDSEWALMVGHSVTADEVELAERLGIPAYGPPPPTARWGTKSGSRTLFERAGVPVAPGGSARTRSEVVAVVERLREAHPGLDRVVVKHDAGVSGLGNGSVDLRTDRTVEECLDDITLEAEDASVEGFYARLAEEGGVVEVFVDGQTVTAPSAQVRVSPSGVAEVLSTHEQLVGGRHGLTYEGCAMPASGRYAAALAEHAVRVGELLAAEGVFGRFAIDFLVVDDGPEPDVYALEINLRNGGTTHPLNTLAALCEGGYDAADGCYRTLDGAVRCYRATDHLVDPRLASLTTEELLDLVAADGLGWDPEARSGVVLHMASGIAGMGVVGLTAIAPTPTGADTMFDRVRELLLAAAVG